MKRFDLRGEGAPSGDPDEPGHEFDDHETVLDWQPGDPWRPGIVVGQRYELFEQIGEGAFGVVFRARDRVADEIVALKLLSKRPSTEVAAHLRHEVQIARRITHPGVVRTHDLVEIGDNLVVSMEYVEGETLSHRVKREPPLTVEEVMNLATDLSRALAAAHAVGVVHRDLKPANIILRAKNGRAVIADFGISHVQHATETAVQQTAPSVDDGMVVGTPLYMAPEQLLGKEVGPAADVYAFGLVLYEAAARKRPFPGVSATQLATARVKTAAPRLETERPELPNVLCQTIRRCLVADPAERPTDGEALKTALLKRAPLSARARRWLVWSSVIVVVGLAALIAWRSFGPRDRTPTLRTFAIGVDNRGGDADAWIGKPVARMAAKKLEHAYLGSRPVDDAKRADMAVKLHYKRTPEGIEIEVELATIGGVAKKIGTVKGSSVAAALDQAIAQIAARFHPRTPDPDANERADMQHLGVHSIEAYRRYVAVLDDEFSAVLIDPEAQVRDIRAILKIEPHWAHAYTDLIDAVGIGSPQGKELLAEAKKATQNTQQDPVGRQMLKALEHISQGKLDDAADLLDPAFRAQPQDLHLGWILARRVFHQAGRAQEAIAVYQRLYEQRPDLQFGSNLTDELRRAGRGREVAAVVAAWFGKAPESEDARAAQVKLDVENGRLDLAIQRAREQVFLHGDAPHRLANLCDVLIAAGENAEASQLAQRMLRGSGPIRSRGWVRLGIIAAIEGRFSAAREAYDQAIAEGKPFATQSGLRQAYESMRWLSVLTGHLDDADRFDKELAEYYRTSGLAWVAATVDFERSLLHISQTGCPDPETTLAKLPPGPGVRLARLQMRRAAAGNGCLSCTDVVGDGISIDESSQYGLYQFGMCAVHEGALALARDAFIRAAALRITATDPGSLPSEMHAMLSHYQLARVLEKMGSRAEARKEYEVFLSHWGQADRPLAEVDDARKAVERLR